MRPGRATGRGRRHGPATGPRFTRYRCPGRHLGRPSHRFTCHRCEQPLRMVRPAHRLGDCAGRSPGSRVVALRPAFPVSQWPTRTKGSPLTVAGAATASAEPARVPSCLPGAPGNQHIGSIPRSRPRVKTMHTERRACLRNCRRCGFAATESRMRSWHSGPACGLWGHRTPAAVTMPATHTASYAILACQYKSGLATDLGTMESARAGTVVSARPACADGAPHANCSVSGSCRRGLTLLEFDTAEAGDRSGSGDVRSIGSNPRLENIPRALMLHCTRAAGRILAHHMPQLD